MTPNVIYTFDLVKVKKIASLYSLFEGNSQVILAHLIHFIKQNMPIKSFAINNQK